MWGWCTADRNTAVLKVDKFTDPIDVPVCEGPHPQTFRSDLVTCVSLLFVGTLYHPQESFQRVL